MTVNSEAPLTHEQPISPMQCGSYGNRYNKTTCPLAISVVKVAITYCKQQKWLRIQWTLKEIVCMTEAITNNKKDHTFKSPILWSFKQPTWYSFSHWKKEDKIEIGHISVLGVRNSKSQTVRHAKKSAIYRVETRTNIILGHKAEQYADQILLC